MQNKLWVIEGPDRVGKTSYTKQLQENRKIPVYKFSEPENVDLLYDFCLCLNSDSIFDRSWLSRLFYTYIRDGRIVWYGLEQISILEDHYMKSHEIEYHICIPKWKDVENLHLKEIRETDSKLSLSQRYMEHINWEPFIFAISKFLKGEVFLYERFKFNGKGQRISRSSKKLAFRNGLRRNLFSSELLRTVEEWEKIIKRDFLSVR